MDILSEAAQEQNNNNDPSNRLAPHGRDSNTHTHTHARPNGRHNTQYINIAVTSLNTIQPKVMQTQTLFTAPIKYFITALGLPRQEEATKYPLCMTNVMINQ